MALNTVNIERQMDVTNRWRNERLHELKASGVSDTIARYACERTTYKGFVAYLTRKGYGKLFK